MKYLSALIKKLEEKNICMKKATEFQMQDLFGLASPNILPEAYIEFMGVMGNGAEGKFMGGESCFMDEIHILKQGAVELLEENKSENTLSNEDFVFWMCQGCMFCFFKLTEGDNPPIYFYDENGEDKFIKIADSLVEFLVKKLEKSEKLFKSKEKVKTDIRMVCPYCEQGNVIKAKVKKRNILISICDECDTVWVNGRDKISNVNGMNFDKFMDALKCDPTWNELDLQI